MPLNACLQYVKGLLDGLPSPQYAPVRAILTSAIPAADAFQTDDKGGVLRPVPQCYIWANTIHEDRQTMPRGPGWKKATYRLDLLLQVLEEADDEFRETAFPCLYDAVDFAINTAPIPVFITDPTTFLQSQMLQIGEEQDSEIFIPDSVSMGDQAAIRSTARFTLKIEETFQSLPLAPGNVAGQLMGVKVEGLDEVNRAFSRFSMTKAFVSFADGASVRITAGLSHYAPVGQTYGETEPHKHLRDSIRPVRHTSAGHLSLEFGSDVPQAKFITQGTRAHGPAQRTFLSWVGSEGRIFAKFVRGVQKNPFQVHYWQQVEHRSITGELRQAIARTMSEARKGA